MYIRRSLESFVMKASNQFPVLLVTGAIQVGKTTFLQHLSNNKRTYVTLDDPLILDLAREDPALFMQRFPAPVLIDEIQYAPQLLPYIKMAADRERKTGMYWLTGSQQFQLMDGVSESLAGRVGIVNLLGFSRMEILGKSEYARPFLPNPEEMQRRIRQNGSLPLKDLFQIIWRGSFPAMALAEEMDRDLFYSSYVRTYLQRDVRDLARVGDEMAFLRFLRAAAARTGQLLNMSDMA
ncbi:MAG: ATP-binding protein, partial [Deltaproteobacteria bacterium]|nr:ATP-binding protein [Deltaproteobacteria bacterium]